MIPIAAHRRTSLDLLRFVAIFVVLFHHLHLEENAEHGLLLQGLIRGGWVGVDLFFVLSGFLIGGLLFSELQETGEIRFARFFTRRAFKILPSAYALLFVTVLNYLRIGQLTPDLRIRAIHDLFFIQNYLGPLNSLTWSLAVEEHFYLLLPLTLFLLMKLQSKKIGRGMDEIPRLCVILVIVTLAIRTYNALTTPFNIYVHYFPTHIRLDSLMFGVLLAFWYSYQNPRMVALGKKYRYPFLGIAILLYAPPFIVNRENLYHTTVGYLVYSCGAMMAICALATMEIKSKILNGLAVIGRFSYSIYIWHSFVREALVNIFRRFPDNDFWLQTLCYILGSIGFGILMGKVIEIPFIKLRERFFPSRRQSQRNFKPTPASVVS